MELSSLLFSVGLFSAGIWLIFTISGDFKEKRRQGQRTASVRPPHPARRVSSSRAPGITATSALRISTTPPVDAPRAQPNEVDKQTSTDPFERLTAAFLRETFEKFRRDL